MLRGITSCRLGYHEGCGRQVARSGRTESGQPGPRVRGFGMPRFSAMTAEKLLVKTQHPLLNLASDAPRPPRSRRRQPARQQPRPLRSQRPPLLLHQRHLQQRPAPCTPANPRAAAKYDLKVLYCGGGKGEPIRATLRLRFLNGLSTAAELRRGRAKRGGGRVGGGQGPAATDPDPPKLGAPRQPRGRDESRPYMVDSDVNTATAQS